jgi:hypothetical protein
VSFLCATRKERFDHQDQESPRIPK